MLIITYNRLEIELLKSFPICGQSTKVTILPEWNSGASRRGCMRMSIAKYRSGLYQQMGTKKVIKVTGLRLQMDKKLT